MSSVSLKRQSQLGRMLLFGALLVVAGCAPAQPAPRPAARSAALAANQQGVAAEGKDDLERARAAFAEASQRYAAIEDYPGLATAQLNLARVERRLGRLPAARGAVDRALEVASPASELHAEALFEKALLLLAQGDAFEAATYAERALNTAAAERRGRARNLLARIALERGEPELATTLASTALTENLAITERRELANSWRLLGASALMRKESTRATEGYRQALVLDKEFALSGRIADDLVGLARSALLSGQSAAASDYLRRAFAVSVSSGDRARGAQLLQELAGLLQQQGLAAEATQLEQQRAALLEQHK